MNTDDAIDRLYQIALNDFVAARNRLAASVKKEHGADAAKQIKTLSKPNASAWAVNQVYWKERWVFDALIAASDRLRTAIESGAVDGAGRDREETVGVAIGRARRFLEENGERASDIVMRRVTTTFDTLASYGSSNPDPLRGRLSQDLQPAGFGAFAGVAPPIAPPAQPERTPDPIADPAPNPNDDETERKAAQRQADLDALAQLEAALDVDRLTLAAATERAAALRDELNKMGRRLQEAEDAEQVASQNLEATQAALSEARAKSDA